jgi:hypothetical protein
VAALRLLTGYRAALVLALLISLSVFLGSHRALGPPKSQTYAASGPVVRRADGSVTTIGIDNDAGTPTGVSYTFCLDYSEDSESWRRLHSLTQATTFSPARTLTRAEEHAVQMLALERWHRYRGSETTDIDNQVSQLLQSGARVTWAESHLGLWLAHRASIAALVLVAVLAGAVKFGKHCVGVYYRSGLRNWNQGKCPACEYPAAPQQDRCPECGTVYRDFINEARGGARVPLSQNSTDARLQGGPGSRADAHRN